MLPVAIGAALATRKGKLLAGLIGALAGVLLLGALFGAGYYYGSKHTTNAIKAEQLDAEKDTTSKLNAALVDNARLERQLAEARNSKQVIYRTIEKEVPRVVTKYIEKPGDVPRDLPDCPVTRGFVGLWDDALFGRMPAAARIAPGAAGETDPAAGQRDLELAPGIGRGEILTNHIANAQTCDAIRDQLNALIDWHEQQMNKDNQ